MKIQLVIICALIGFAAFANGRATYRDSMGRNKGYATTRGKRRQIRIQGEGTLKCPDITFLIRRP